MNAHHDRVPMWLLLFLCLAVLGMMLLVVFLWWGWEASAMTALTSTMTTLIHLIIRDLGGDS